MLTRLMPSALTVLDLRNEREKIRLIRALRLSVGVAGPTDDSATNDLTEPVCPVLRWICTSQDAGDVGWWGGLHAQVDGVGL